MLPVGARVRWFSPGTPVSPPEVSWPQTGPVGDLSSAGYDDNVARGEGLPSLRQAGPLS